MLKFTKQSVIAFDFKEALSFEGETGPYAQYAVVRATNIFRKGGVDPDSFCQKRRSLSSEDFAKYLDCRRPNEIWELWLAASKTSYIVDQCIATTEPAYLAKHVFQLAQLFNTFYHRHPILSEADEKPEEIPAGDRGRGPARTDPYLESHGHHRPAGHVECVPTRGGVAALPCRVQELHLCPLVR